MSYALIVVAKSVCYLRKSYHLFGFTLTTTFLFLICCFFFFSSPLCMCVCVLWCFFSYCLILYLFQVTFFAYSFLSARFGSAEFCSRLIISCVLQYGVFLYSLSVCASIELLLVLFDSFAPLCTFIHDSIWKCWLFRVHFKTSRYSFSSFGFGYCPLSRAPSSAY